MRSMRSRCRWSTAWATVAGVEAWPARFGSDVRASRPRRGSMTSRATSSGGYRAASPLAMRGSRLDLPHPPSPRTSRCGAPSNRSSQTVSSRCSSIPNGSPAGSADMGGPAGRPALPRSASLTSVGSRRNRGAAAPFWLGMARSRTAPAGPGRATWNWRPAWVRPRPGSLGRPAAADRPSSDSRGSFRRSSRRPPRFSRRPGRSSAQRLAARTRWTP